MVVHEKIFQKQTKKSNEIFLLLTKFEYGARIDSILLKRALHSSFVDEFVRQTDRQTDSLKERGLDRQSGKQAFKCTL